MFGIRRRDSKKVFSNTIAVVFDRHDEIAGRRKSQKDKIDNVVLSQKDFRIRLANTDVG
ncbi:MAG: hypothetical protein JWM42_1539, partial [Burkholderia sp.]|nr:hypothetical protein [Burkholderia sp.]